MKMNKQYALHLFVGLACCICCLIQPLFVFASAPSGGLAYVMDEAAVFASSTPSPSGGGTTVSQQSPPTPSGGGTTVSQQSPPTPSSVGTTVSQQASPIASCGASPTPPSGTTGSSPYSTYSPYGASSGSQYSTYPPSSPSGGFSSTQATLAQSGGATSSPPGSPTASDEHSNTAPSTAVISHDSQGPPSALRDVGIQSMRPYSYGGSPGSIPSAEKGTPGQSNKPSSLKKPGTVTSGVGFKEKKVSDKKQKASNEEQKMLDKEAVDTINISSGGNWLLKRVWWEKIEKVYENIKNLFTQILNKRMAFFEKRNTLDRELDAFYSAIGIEQGPLEDILNYVLEVLEKEEKRQGFLSKKEHALSDAVQHKKREIEQLNLDVKALQGLDDKIDEALKTLLEQINACGKYEHKAWEYFKGVAHELDDKKARADYYQTEGLLKDIQKVEKYLDGPFLQYFDKSVSSARDHMQRITSQLKELHANGVDLKKEVAKVDNNDEIDDDIKQKKEQKIKKDDGWLGFVVGPVMYLYQSVIGLVKKGWDKIASLYESGKGKVKKAYQLEKKKLSSEIKIGEQKIEQKVHEYTFEGQKLLDEVRQTSDQTKPSQQAKSPSLKIALPDNQLQKKKIASPDKQKNMSSVQENMKHDATNVQNVPLPGEKDDDDDESKPSQQAESPSLKPALSGDQSEKKKSASPGEQNKLSSVQENMKHDATNVQNVPLPGEKDDDDDETKPSQQTKSPSLKTALPDNQLQNKNFPSPGEHEKAVQGAR